MDGRPGKVVQVFFAVLLYKQHRHAMRNPHAYSLAHHDFPTQISLVVSAGSEPFFGGAEPGIRAKRQSVGDGSPNNVRHGIFRVGAQIQIILASAVENGL